MNTGMEDLADALAESEAPIESLLRALYDRRFTGAFPLTLHFRGGRIQAVDLLSPTRIDLRPHPAPSP